MTDLSKRFEVEAPIDRPFEYAQRRSFVTILLASEQASAVEQDGPPVVTDADVRRLDERYLTALRITRNDERDAVTLTYFVIDNGSRVVFEVRAHCLPGLPLAWETSFRRLSAYDGHSPHFRTGSLPHAEAVEVVRALARTHRGQSTPPPSP